LHAWIVIFILPVNSAVNPLLYTFTTPKFRERLSEDCLGKVRNYILKKYSRQGLCSNMSNCLNSLIKMFIAFITDSQASVTSTTNKKMITDRNIIQRIWNECDDDRRPSLLEFNDENARFEKQN